MITAATMFAPVVLLTLTVVLIPARLEACDCPGPPTLSPAVRNETPVIFSGRVVEIVERNEHTSTTSATGATTEVRPIERFVAFEVRSAWAGVQQKRFAVSAEMSDCLYPFRIGETYLVFAHRDERGRVWTDRCTRTTVLERAGAILGLLGAPTLIVTADVVER